MKTAGVRRVGRRVSLAIFSGLALSALACGGGGGGGGGDANNTNNYPTDPIGGTMGSGGTVSHSLSVGVVNSMYTPDATSVPKGSTVTWTWNSCDGGGYNGAEVCTSHSVTFDDGIASATQDHGSFARTFTAAGTYKYHCAVHGAAMSGTVTVE